MAATMMGAFKHLIKIKSDVKVLAVASESIQRAQSLRNRFTAEAGTDPFTSVDQLVEKLKSIVLPSNQ